MILRSLATYRGPVPSLCARQAFKTLHTGLDEDELHEICNMIDEDRSGRIEKSEFIRVLTELFEHC